MKIWLERYVAQFVYGGIDGTVTTFAIVAAAAGARFSVTVVIILGAANLIADGFSMGTSAYLSAKSERDVERKNGREIHREHIPPLYKGLATFGSFVVVGFIPILAYVADAMFGLGNDDVALFAISGILTGVAFILVGVMKGKVAGTRPVKAAAETLLLGGVAAIVAYGLGDVLARALGAE